jgi:hypothetical protein
MPDLSSGAKALFTTLSDSRKRIADIFTTLSDRAGGVIKRAANRDNVILPRAKDGVLAETDKVIAGAFVGPDGRTPFGRDGLTGLADYPAALSDSLKKVTAEVADKHAHFMERTLQPDLINWLRRAEPPGENSNTPFGWVDPNGLQLSDRVWQTSLRTRAKINAMIADGIRRGVDADTLARQLEQFLVPGRAPLRGNPSGIDASADAMRLARSEIARAHGTVIQEAVRANPYTGGVDWVLSPNHTLGDECDEVATIDRRGNRRRPPYSPDRVPVYPNHPYEMCVLRAAPVQNVAQMTYDLRQRYQRGEAPPFTPLAQGFVKFLTQG